MDEGSLRKSLQELLKLMLLVWCKENQAIKLVAAKKTGKVSIDFFLCESYQTFFVFFLSSFQTILPLGSSELINLQNCESPIIKFNVYWAESAA